MESSVFWSGEVVHFLTHSREAPSRVDRVQYTDLAAVRLLFIIKLWDMFYYFVTGYGGKGGISR